jgi:L-ascorbate metabolism protein UlaG (beta-lactamase superfamily)
MIIRYFSRRRREALVDIIWHGHSCFEVRGQNATIVFDPFGGIGLPEPKAKAGIVLCSHSHPDHNNVKQVLKEGGVALEGFVGQKDVEGVAVSGIATLHDSAGGSQRGKNSVYVVQLDGLKLCHLGDLGHDLTVEQAKEIGKVDVLFTPVAGGATIGPDVAWSVIAKLGPKVIMPMHYGSGRSAGNPWIARVMPIPIDEFLKDKKNIERINGSTFSVTKDNLPKQQKIVVPKLPV